MKARICVAVTVGLVALAVPASASGAVTIGNNLGNAEVAGPICSGAPCTLSQTFLPAANTAAGGLFAPSDGVVVRWRIKVGSNTSPVAFRITRPGGSHIGTGAGTGPTVTPAVNDVSEYELQLPIQAGDAIGLNCCFNAQLDAMGSAMAGRVLWAPPLQDGQPASAGSVEEAASNKELLISADIEPDCDGDGLGDETQDAVVPPGGNCPKADRAIALEASKDKVKRGRKVSFSGQLDALGNVTACESSQLIELQRKKPTQNIFATVDLLQTTPTGNFTARQKVKKTYEYRAQVAESDACFGQTSNTEKVKAKKKT